MIGVLLNAYVFQQIAHAIDGLITRIPLIKTIYYSLTGAKPLPPGIQKNLARGKPMPPGIQKTRMPDGFISQLPHHPGHEWQQAGGDLVLVASGSLVISDILEGVFD